MEEGETKAGETKQHISKKVKRGNSNPVFWMIDINRSLKYVNTAYKSQTEHPGEYQSFVIPTAEQKFPKGTH